MRLKSYKDQSGVVIVIVVIIIMALAILSANIFSQSLSQTRTSRAQSDQVAFEQLSKGAFWGVHNKATDELNNTGSITYPVVYALQQTMNGRTYTATATLCNPADHYDSSLSPACSTSGSSPNVGVDLTSS